MYSESFEAASNAAAKKVNLLKNNPFGYVLLSLLAGMYIGFGILLAFTIGSQMGTSPVANLVKGLIFGVALSLVVIPGAELFTGNNFVMGAGLLKKKVSVGQAFLQPVGCLLAGQPGRSRAFGLDVRKLRLRLASCGCCLHQGRGCQDGCPGLAALLAGHLV